MHFLLIDVNVRDEHIHELVRFHYLTKLKLPISYTCFFKKA